MEDALKAALRMRAAEHGRSMEEEARQILENSFRGLPIVAAHALRIWELPDHHQDPFDRTCISSFSTGCC